MAARSRRPRIVRILVWVAVIVLILLVVAEIALRALISHGVKEDVPGASIRLGGYPLVLSLPHHTVKSVELDVPDTVVITYPDVNTYTPTIAGDPASHVVIHDLTFNGQHDLRAGTLDLHSTLHDDYLLAIVQQSVARATKDNEVASTLLQVTGLHTTS